MSGGKGGQEGVQQVQLSMPWQRCGSFLIQWKPELCAGRALGSVDTMHLSLAASSQPLPPLGFLTPRLGPESQHRESIHPECSTHCLNCLSL